MITIVLVIVLIGYLLFRRKKEEIDPRFDCSLEEGYFRPPSKCKSELQPNGTIIRFRTYFEDVLSEDWPHCKLIPTYTKVLLMNGGDEKLLGIVEGPYWG